MQKLKKMILVSVIVALASQIGIGLTISNFRISAGIISFVLFILHYKDLKTIQLGFSSGIMVFILRAVVYYIANGNLNNIIIFYLPEVLFYVFYSIIYSILLVKINKENINLIFLIAIISDFIANFIEVFVRNYIYNSIFLMDIIFTLLFISFIRSSIIWIILNGFKYYKMLLLKEEHEDRYKKLLYFTSKLKTEMYWIEKNMDNIENVMSESYELFEKISTNEDEESWAERALNISRNVHEIKKENSLVVRGIKEITEDELKDNGMNFKDIMNILSETMKREARFLGKDIEFNFNIKENFYTLKHYYLISIVRNLIRNSIDAIDSSNINANIRVTNNLDDKNYYLIVEDNGNGIDEDGLNHIFSPGFSTKINYDTGEINRGLGLSIVKYITENQLKGKIEIDSKLGKGTKFSISIPREILEEDLNEDIHI